MSLFYTLIILYLLPRLGINITFDDNLFSDGCVDNSTIDLFLWVSDFYLIFFCFIIITVFKIKIYSFFIFPAFSFKTLDKLFNLIFILSEVFFPDSTSLFVYYFFNVFYHSSKLIKNFSDFFYLIYEFCDKRSLNLFLFPILSDEDKLNREAMQITLIFILIKGAYKFYYVLNTYYDVSVSIIL